MAEGFGGAFTQTFLQADAQQQAQAHAVAQQILAQQAQAYAQDPNNPTNQLATAHANYYSQLPDRERVAETNAAAREKVAQINSDRQHMGNVLDLVFRYGAPPAPLVATLPPDMQEQVKQAVMAPYNKQYQQDKTSADTANATKADDLDSLMSMYGMMAPDPSQSPAAPTPASNGFNPADAALSAIGATGAGVPGPAGVAISQMASAAQQGTPAGNAGAAVGNALGSAVGAGQSDAKSAASNAVLNQVAGQIDQVANTPDQPAPTPPSWDAVGSMPIKNADQLRKESQDAAKAAHWQALDKIKDRDTQIKSDALDQKYGLADQMLQFQKDREAHIEVSRQLKAKADAIRAQAANTTANAAATNATTNQGKLRVAQQALDWKKKQPTDRATMSVIQDYNKLESSDLSELRNIDMNLRKIDSEAEDARGVLRNYGLNPDRPPSISDLSQQSLQDKNAPLWMTDPKAMKQVSDALSTVSAVDAKKQVLQTNRQVLDDHINGPAGYRAQKRLLGAGRSTAGGAPTTPAAAASPSGSQTIVTSKAQFDALPSGTLFQDRYGNTRKKP